jgi:hypothetical protein
MFPRGACTDGKYVETISVAADLFNPKPHSPDESVTQGLASKSSNLPPQENKATQAPDFLLLPEKRSVLSCINAAIICLGEYQKNFIRYKDLKSPSGRAMDYVGSWEDKTMGFTSFSRLSQLFLERGVSVSVVGTVTIEDVKSVIFPLKRERYSNIMFLVSGVLKRVA